MRLLLLLLLLPLVTRAQTTDYKTRFVASYRAGNKAEAEQTLRDWEKQQPNDPEYYIVRFNLLEQEAEALKPKSGGMHVVYQEDLEKAMKNGELDKTMSEEKANQKQMLALLQQATDVLRKGIALAPDRLDMRFGLAKTYEAWEEPALQVQVLRDALADHAKTTIPWRWRDGAPLPQPEAEFWPHALEGYANYYWQEKQLVLPQDMHPRDEDQAKEYGRQLAELSIQYYPHSSLGYFNLGIYYSLKEQWANAATQLQKADALQPNDPYTALNLARTALKQKQKAEAQRYLQRIQKVAELREEVDALTADIKKLR